MKNAFIIGLIVLLGLAAFVAYQERDFGGVPITHEYNSTNTEAMTGSDCKADVDHLISYNPYSQTTLGSVIVASTTDQQVRIVNATTTDSDGFYANSSSTVATLPANLPAGTYTFDVTLDKGLALDFEDGFCGGYVFTWR